MHKSKKTVVAAILAAGLMTGTAYAQQGVNEIGGTRAVKASDSTQSGPRSRPASKPVPRRTIGRRAAGTGIRSAGRVRPLPAQATRPAR